MHTQTHLNWVPSPPNISQNSSPHSSHTHSQNFNETLTVGWWAVTQSHIPSRRQGGSSCLLSIAIADTATTCPLHFAAGSSCHYGLLFHQQE